MDKIGKIRKVVIVGGGTAGWMTAAMLTKVLGGQLEIELVESDAIGIIGVGEATIPPIQTFNQVLGLDESEFIRETKASIKLAIRFENWKKNGEQYYHTFGAPGRSQAFCSFQHYWLRGQRLGDKHSLWDFDLNYLCCERQLFARLKTDDPFYEIPYAYHFDAGLYGQYLRRLSEAAGVRRVEGMIDSVMQDSAQGFVTGLKLQSGQVIEGDFFIDCSGMRGLLIQQTLQVGYEDWNHWLPCDRAYAVPSEKSDITLPFTRSIARSAGWQWRIPLQHRNGNGLVFSSAHMTDDQAAATLMENIGSSPLGEPRLLKFRTGRTLKQWSHNVVAVGLSSGFLEPLESTSIHLIQSAIVRLIKLFPHHGISEAQITEYNKESQSEIETIRDFIILHYVMNEREDSDFWQDLQRIEIPSRLADKIATFKESGVIFQDQLDIFKESSWLQVMVGQGITPLDYHPIADILPDKQLLAALNDIAEDKQRPLEKLFSHDEFLRRAINAGRPQQPGV